MGLTRIDQEWSERLEAALTATRRYDVTAPLAHMSL